MSYYDDYPIRKAREDVLNRNELAKRIADDIYQNASVNDSNSIVFGISGEWGSGKTSFLELILDWLLPEY